MIRRTLHKIHLWAGVVLCVPLVLLGLTGSILVFQHELEAPHVMLAAGVPHTAGEIITAVRAVTPEGFSPSMYRPGGEKEPATLFLAPSHKKPAGGGQGGGRMQMLVDPVSLQVISTKSSNGFVRSVHDLHANLMLRDYGGRSIIGWFGVAMLIFGLSGIVMWWPKHGNWKKAFVVRPGVNRFVLYRDLHKAAGIWSWLIFIVVSFSGVYLAFPQTIDGMVSEVSPLRDLRAPPAEKITPVEDADAMPVDDVVTLALQSVPLRKLSYIAIPGKKDQPYRIGLSRLNASDGAPVVTVFVDPWAKRVLEVRDPQGYSAGETFSAWQHALHAGQGLGWIWRIAVFLMGFLPLLFSITGVSMWLIKRQAKQKV